MTYNMAATRATHSTSDWSIIGVGNPWRGDDGVGAEVVHMLRARDISSAQLSQTNGEGIELMRLWRGAKHVIVVDATNSGASPGAIHRFDADTDPLPTVFHYSSHAFSLAEAVELSRALGELPEQLLVFGIEGQDFAAGNTLTAPVAAAAEQVSAMIDRLIQQQPAAENIHA